MSKFFRLIGVAIVMVSLLATSVVADSTGERRFETQILIADIEGGKLQNEVHCYTDLTLDEIFAAVRCRKGSCTLEERELWYSKVLYLEVYPGYIQSVAVNIPTALGDKAMVAAPHGPYWVKMTRHLVFRIYLEGSWKYPVAVQAVFIPADRNPPIQHGYKFATTYQRWIRLDFDLPVGNYKLFAYAGYPREGWCPDPIWAATGPIPLRVDRDKDITITLRDP